LKNNKFIILAEVVIEEPKVKILEKIKIAKKKMKG